MQGNDSSCAVRLDTLTFIMSNDTRFKITKGCHIQVNPQSICYHIKRVFMLVNFNQCHMDLKTVGTVV